MFISLSATADSVGLLFVYITLAGLASALFHRVGAAITGAVADSIGLEKALLWMIVPLLLALAITAAIPEKKPVKIPAAT